MSFIKIRISVGPRTNPCGTPEVIFSNDEFLPFRTTHCFRSDSQSYPFVFVGCVCMLCKVWYLVVSRVCVVSHVCGVFVVCDVCVWCVVCV